MSRCNDASGTWNPGSLAKRGLVVLFEGQDQGVLEDAKWKDRKDGWFADGGKKVYRVHRACRGMCKSRLEPEGAPCKAAAPDPGPKSQVPARGDGDPRKSRYLDAAQMHNARDHLPLTLCLHSRELYKYLWRLSIFVLGNDDHISSIITFIIYNRDQDPILTQYPIVP